MPESQPGDVFVATTDLSASKAPPKPSALIRFITDSNVVRVVGVLYLLAVFIVWPALSPAVAALPFVSEGLIFALVIVLPFGVFATVEGLRLRRVTGIPLWRNLETLREFIQIGFLFALMFAAFTLVQNLQVNLSNSGLLINFNVLGRTYGTEVSEGPDPNQVIEWAAIPLVGNALDNWTWLEPDTNFRALAVGFINTLRVVSLSLVATTVLGVLVGVGLLSGNWLLRTTSNVFVEIFRNTPLLVQLFFIYNGVIRLLPSPRNAIELPGSVYLSGRGVWYPSVELVPAADVLWVLLLLGALGGYLVARWRTRLSERTGQPANASLYFVGVLTLSGVIGYALASAAVGGTPFVVDFPELGRFNLQGGASLSAEYLGLFLGLTLYTAAFIADIVRAGIQSVEKGQIEASRALGLTNGQTLNQVVLPQALRLAVPPLTNQYLNLAKNSSLAIAIGFADIYTVASIANNQTGQSIALFSVLMMTYLGLSLVISLIMNLFNQTLRYRTR